MFVIRQEKCVNIAIESDSAFFRFGVVTADAELIQNWGDVRLVIAQRFRIGSDCRRQKREGPCDNR